MAMAYKACAITSSLGGGKMGAPERLNERVSRRRPLHSTRRQALLSRTAAQRLGAKMRRDLLRCLQTKPRAFPTDLKMGKFPGILADLGAARINSSRSGSV